MLVTHSEWSGHVLDSGIADEHCLDRPVATSSRISFDGFDNVHTVEHLSKHDMLPIQPLGLDSGDEELRAVGVLASIGHRQPAGALVLQSEVLVLELVPVDRLSASSVSSGEVSALEHEVLDDSMEGAALVSLRLLPGGQRGKVLHSSGHHISKQSDLDGSSVCSANGDVEEDFLGHLGTRLSIRSAAAAGDDDHQNCQSASKPQDLNQSSGLHNG